MTEIVNTSMSDYVTLDRAAAIARQAVEDQELSQRQVARELDVNQAAVSRALKGRSEYKGLLTRILRRFADKKLKIEKPRYPIEEIVK